MKSLTLMIIIVIFILSGCSGKSREREIARQKGIEAASNLLTINKDDQMALQNSILEAKAIESEYIIAGDTVTAKEFEKAYMEHVATHDSLMAKEIF